MFKKMQRFVAYIAIAVILDLSVFSQLGNFCEKTSEDLQLYDIVDFSAKSGSIYSLFTITPFVHINVNTFSTFKSFQVHSISLVICLFSNTIKLN